MTEFKILRFPGGTGLEICVSEGQVSSLETKKSKVQMCAEEEQWINWANNNKDGVAMQKQRIRPQRIFVDAVRGQ